MRIADELADVIGPRPACSDAERRASELCARRLEGLGYEVGVEGFPSRPAYAPWFIAYLSAAVFAAILIPVSPPVGAVIGAVALLLYARDSDGRPLIRPRGGTSQNVVARPPGQGLPDTVVMAHVDSARSSPPFHPRMVRHLRGTVVTLNVVLVLVPAAASAAWLFDTHRAETGRAWIASLLLAAYLTFTIALLAMGTRMPLVAGANDNASGVEVLMRLAADDASGSVWYVVTGSEEVGMVGAQAFIDRHPEAVAAVFVNIDSVGAGEVIAASAEGSFRERRPPGWLIDLAEAAGPRTRPFRAMPTDAVALQARGHRAISLLAVNQEGSIAEWHRPTDVLGRLDEATIDTATAVSRRLVKGIRQEAGEAGNRTKMDIHPDEDIPSRHEDIP